MAKKAESLIDEASIAVAINTRADGSFRHGTNRAYAPAHGAVQECVAIETIKYDSSWPTGSGLAESIVAIWDNGAVTMNGSILAGVTVDLGTARWPQIVPVNTVRWDTSSSTWKPISVLLFLTRSKNYIFDPTKPDTTNYLYEIPLSAANVPTAASAGGNVPAGTYRYVVTELSAHGAESPKSTALSVTVGVDSKITISKGVTVNTGAVRWRVYRSQRGDVAGKEIYRLVGEAAIATTSIDDNLVPSSLGLRLLEGRLPIPTGVTVGCVHRGLVVTSGNLLSNGSVYVSDVAIDETGNGSTGYPEPSGFIAELATPNGKRVTALASVNGKLLVFTEDSIDAYDGDITSNFHRITLSNAVGTSSYRTIAKYADVVFFMDKERGKAWVTDGNTVETLGEGHLFDGIWYRLSGTQAIEKYEELQGQFTAQIVVADPEHQVVMFGGEIVSSTYAGATIDGGTWSEAAVLANPQSNRQFAWKVFEMPTKKWHLWTNLMVRSYCTNGGKVWFGDHKGAIWKMNEKDAVDGGTTVLCTAAVSASAGTTITLSTGTWGGVVTVDAPVTIINVATGAMQFRHAVSATSNTLVIDRAATVTADCVVAYGLVIADVWLQPLDMFAHIFETKYHIWGQTQGGRLPLIGLCKSNASVSTWINFAKLVPQVSHYVYSGVNVRGGALLFRFILPSGSQASTHIETYSNIRLGKISLIGVPIAKERY